MVIIFFLTTLYCVVSRNVYFPRSLPATGTGTFYSLTWRLGEQYRRALISKTFQGILRDVWRGSFYVSLRYHVLIRPRRTRAPAIPFRRIRTLVVHGRSARSSAYIVIGMKPPPTIWLLRYEYFFTKTNDHSRYPQ